MFKEWAETICVMDSPRVGFRRAALVSWTLTGIGIAGVAGASALAHSDTVKPPVAQAAVLVGEPVPNTPPPAPDVPSSIVDTASDSGSRTLEPPELTTGPAPTTTGPAPIVARSAPVVSEPPPEVPVPRSPQVYAPTPEPTATLHPPAPAPTTKVQNGFPIRTSHSPAGGGSSTNKFTPHTVSRGS